MTPTNRKGDLELDNLGGLLLVIILILVLIGIYVLLRSKHSDILTKLFEVLKYR